MKEFEESDDATNFESFTLRQPPRSQVVDQREFCLQFSCEDNGAEFTRADSELGLDQHQLTGILNSIHPALATRAAPGNPAPETTTSAYTSAEM